MKEPIWDDCKFYTACHNYMPGDSRKHIPKHAREVAIGMTVTAFHNKDSVEIRIDNILVEEKHFAGTIVRIDTDDETSGALAVGDKVVISIGKICHIDQNIA